MAHPTAEEHDAGHHDGHSRTIIPSLRLNSYPIGDDNPTDDTLESLPRRHIGHPAPPPSVSAQDSLLVKSQDVQLSPTLGDILILRSLKYYSKSIDAKFWNYACLIETVTRPQIMQELESPNKGGNMSSDESAGWCKKILPPESMTPASGGLTAEGAHESAYRRIFALLALLSCTKDIRHFIREELSDTRISMERAELIDEIIKQHCSWDRNSIICHLYHRRGIMVPYFDTANDESVEVMNRTFDARTLFPWTEEIWSKIGGYSSVTKYKVDRGSHNFQRVLDPVSSVVSFYIVCPVPCRSILTGGGLGRWAYPLSTSLLKPWTL